MLISHPTTDNIKAPQNAGQKPDTTNPSTIVLTNQNSSPFRISENKPRVKIVMGSVNRNKTGLISALIKPKINAVTIAA